MVIREFRCGDCSSTFESSDPVEEVVCPHCTADEPERVFLTPPAFKSDKTRVADMAQRDLAQTYGLSDMSNRNGSPVKSAPVDAPARFDSSPQAMGMLSKLGKHADSFSPLMGALHSAGGPRPDWAFRDSKNRPIR